MANISNKNGLNREYGNPTPAGTGGSAVKSGSSRTIGPIKGRYTFRKTGFGVGTDKSAPTGLDNSFGNAIPHELGRDPYKVNKNAK